VAQRLARRAAVTHKSLRSDRQYAQHQAKTSAAAVKRNGIA